LNDINVKSLINNYAEKKQEKNGLSVDFLNKLNYQILTQINASLYLILS